jgi:transglutaminase-like putative cysteine protease
VSTLDPVDGAVPDRPGPRRYSLVHRTAYEYDDLVTSSFGLTHLLPRVTDNQRPLAARLEIEPEPLDVREHVDFFGNRAAYVEVDTPHTRLVVTARSEVEVLAREPIDLQQQTTAWEEVRDQLAGSLGTGVLAARPYLLPSPLVPSWPEVASYAAQVFTPGRPVGAALADLTDRVHADFAYQPGATTVKTTLPQLLETREGVCQDFAHLAVGMLRSVGLAARYVSGYLETTPPDGRSRLVGADASHAWVATYLPDLGWVELDPTNNQLVDDRYVVAAFGRDYGDVTPVQGVIFTESTRSSLRVEVDLSRLS